MMDGRYVLAYDFGTSGVKGALVDLQGEVIATVTVDYPLYTPHPGWAEQDPALYWQSVCAVTRQVLQGANVAPSCVAGMAFGTQWKGIIPVDAGGNVLHNSIIWLDARAADQARRLNERFGEGLFAASDYWPKLMWLRENHPDCIKKATWILDANSFLKWKATGVAAMDTGNCFVRSFDPVLDRLYADILAFADIPREKFPKRVWAEEQVGRVTEQAAAELGLVPGIPVFGGNNDIGAIAVGAGCADIGGVHMYFGSSGWIGYTVPHMSDELYISPFDCRRDVFLFAMQAIGLSFNWVVERLYGKESAALGSRVFAFVDEEVKEIPPGAEGVLATPWFYGERPPLFGVEARGNFLNLGPRHDRRHLARAMMEGVCYQLRLGAEYNSEKRGFPWPAAINVVGGGSCSDVWMQILADVMNTPIRVPAAPRHAGAVGTAYSALIGLGICSDYAEAARQVRIERTFLPIPAHVETYQRSFEAFRGIYHSLAPLFKAMN